MIVWQTAPGKITGVPTPQGAGRYDHQKEECPAPPGILDDFLF